VQYLKNMIYWEERWHLQSYDFEFPEEVGLVDYDKVLRLAGLGEKSTQDGKTRGRAVREQREWASERILWPVVDEKGNTHAVNRHTGLFEEMNPRDVSPKGTYPPPPVEVEFLDLWRKLQGFRYFGECEDYRDGYARAWAVNQLEVRHPFMYQALLAEVYVYSAEDQHIYGARTRIEREPGWSWRCEWPETDSESTLYSEKGSGDKVFKHYENL
jgi:hypothetical protein